MSFNWANYILEILLAEGFEFQASLQQKVCQNSSPSLWRCHFELMKLQTQFVWDGPSCPSPQTVPLIRPQLPVPAEVQGWRLQLRCVQLIQCMLLGASVYCQEQSNWMVSLDPLQKETWEEVLCDDGCLGWGKLFLVSAIFTYFCNRCQLPQWYWEVIWEAACV